MIQTDLYSFSFRQGTLVPWCKSCGASNFWRNGRSESGKQVYKCKTCGFRFVWISDLPNRRFFSSVISFAVELYTSLIGISLRTVSLVMSKLGFNVSYEGVRQWVLAAKKVISRREIIKPTTWHVDETYIKIKGKGYWLWIVYDKIGVLSWHISKRRRIKDARILLRAAIIVAGVRPNWIITDGLQQYQYAIKKEIGWNYKEQKKKHIVSSGIGRNWFIERLNREVKRRTNWFSTFQSVKGAKAFFSQWFNNFNKRRHLARNTG